MKKGISFLCALTMLFALTACGGQGSDTDTPSAAIPPPGRWMNHRVLSGKAKTLNRRQKEERL